MKFIKDYSTTTAILLFSQGGNIESVSKPITCQKKQNVLLWEKMNNRVLNTIQKTNIPYFISDGTTQIGNTFGEKITHSIQEVLKKGFEKVIVVGNDCIELRVQHLLDASHKLQTNDVVLGADFNGGAYLIGVTKSSFNAAKFAIISWKTSTVFEELNHLFINQDIAFTARLHDCNTTSDFEKTIPNLSFSASFKNFILSLLQHNTILVNHTFSIVSYEFNALNLNKGSPFSL
jgi:hypothetical protein